MGIDVITVGDELERNGMMADFGIGGKSGRNALAYIREEGFPGNAPTYANNVLDYAAKRRQIELCKRGYQWAENGRSASEISKDLIAAFSDVRVPNHTADTHTMTLGEAVGVASDETIKSSEGGRKIVPTGFCDLDRLLDDGACAPDVHILAARPGQGKTALLLNMAHNAVKGGKRVAFFTLEMANIQLAMRLIAMESGVSFGDQRKGNLSSEGWEKYYDTIKNIEHLPLYLCDLPAISVRQMSRTLRTLEARYGEMDMVMMDYLQLADAEGRYETRQLEVSKVMSGLKVLAKDFDVPIWAAAQLSRAVELRADKRPILSDLRESGSIENDADLVAFIYRPDQYEADTAKNGIAEIIIAKHRNGRVGKEDLLFRKELTKFENCTKRHVNFNEPDTRRRDVFGED